VISSTQAAIDAGRNRFQTASLATSDIQNHSTSKGSSYSVSGSVGFAAGDQSTATTDADKKAAANAQSNVRPGGSAGVGSASGSQTSTTKSGISGIAGDESVRTGDATSTGALVKDWNTTTIVKDVQAQAQITAEFGQNASREIGAYANRQLDESKAIYEQAAREADPAKKEALYAQADEIENNWKEGGAYRIASHAAVGGLTGGAGGAAGAAASSIAIPMLGEQLAELDMPVPVKQALVMAVGATIGAAVGGSAGAASAFNETSNNYLTAASLRSRDQKIKLCQANGNTACEVKVKQEYDLKSANNTGELKRSSLIEKQYLEQTRTDLEQLLLDPKVSEETKGQARKSIKEINTAINVID
jgi:filamentous hemagglutinin